jgi:hypothetical protein
MYVKWEKIFTGAKNEARAGVLAIMELLVLVGA